MDQTELFRVGLEVSITWIVVLVTLELARRERVRSETAIAELRALFNAKVDALQQAMEELSLQLPSGEAYEPTTPENWESIREQWATCRRHLEDALESTHGRARSQLIGLPRHSYEAIIEALRAAERMDLPTAELLRQMDRRFSLVRRTRTATAQQAEEFSRWFDQASPVLQRL